MRFNIDLRQTRAIKFETQIPLDPWESILLADCGEDVVTGDVNIRLPRWSDGRRPLPSV